MTHGVTHIIGAGLAGLAAAVRLAGNRRQVIVHESASQAGGRCRSYHDAAFGGVIDNGNHLLLSGNSSALALVKDIGAEDELTGPATADFTFADLKSGERWAININNGRFPVWLFDSGRRVPGTRPQDYLEAAPLMWAGADAIVTDTLKPEGALYKRLWEPLMVAALNTEPEKGSARLAGAIMRNTLAKGGSACRPVVAKNGLSSAFADPAIRFVEARGGRIQLSHRLRAIQREAGRIAALDFGNGDLVALNGGDDVILAVPPWTAADLLPEITAPTEFRSIVNAHFRIEPPADLPQIVGVVNATVEWIFSFHDRVSITISSADRLVDRPREQLAAEIWPEVAQITGLPMELPPWQIVKEKRATFAATPEQDAKRPGAKTQWNNLFLAGDWTQTGLPATIEGAIRSGERAATLSTKGQRRGYRNHAASAGV